MWNLLSSCLFDCGKSIGPDADWTVSHATSSQIPVIVCARLTLQTGNVALSHSIYGKSVSQRTA
jgi:hypothetical protein